MITCLIPLSGITIYSNRGYMPSLNSDQPVSLARYPFWIHRETVTGLAIKLGVADTHIGSRSTIRGHFVTTRRWLAARIETCRPRPADLVPNLLTSSLKIFNLSIIGTNHRSHSTIAYTHSLAFKTTATVSYILSR